MALAHHRQVLLADPLSRAGRRVAFERLTKIVELRQFLATQRGNETPDPRPMLRQAFAHQLRRRLAHRNQADPNLVGELAIGEPVPRSQFTGKQIVLNMLVGALFKGHFHRHFTARHRLLLQCYSTNMASSFTQVKQRHKKRGTDPAFLNRIMRRCNLSRIAATRE